MRLYPSPIKRHPAVPQIYEGESHVIRRDPQTVVLEQVKKTPA